MGSYNGLIVVRIVVDIFVGCLFSFCIFFLSVIFRLFIYRGGFSSCCYVGIIQFFLDFIDWIRGIYLIKVELIGFFVLEIQNCSLEIVSLYGVYKFGSFGKGIVCYMYEKLIKLNCRVRRMSQI